MAFALCLVVLLAVPCVRLLQAQLSLHIYTLSFPSPFTTTQLLEFAGDEAMVEEEQPTWMSFADDE